MTPNALIEIYMTAMGLNSIAQKQQLLDYLLGTAENPPAITFSGSYIPYNICTILTDQFHTPECGETAKRAYRQLCRMVPTLFININDWNGHVYSEFKEGGIEEVHVETHLTGKIFGMLKGHKWRCKETLEGLQESMTGSENDLSGLGEFYLNYGELAARLIGEALDKEAPTLVTLILLVLGSWWYHEDTEKSREYADKAGELVYSGLKALYREQGSLEGKISGLLTPSSLALYDRMSPNKLDLMNQELSLVILSVSSVMRQASPAFLDAQKLCLVMLLPAVSHEIFNGTTQQLYQLEQELKLPQCTLTELAAEGFFLDEFKKCGSMNAALLEECYQKDRDTFLSVYHKAVKEKDRKMLSMSALLCRYEPDSDGQDGGSKNPVIALLRGNKPQGTYRQQANDNFLTYLSKVDTNHGIEVLYKNKSIGAAALYEKLGGFNDEDVLFRYPNNSMDGAACLLIGAALLYEESKAARDFMNESFLQIYQQRAFWGKLQGENYGRFFFSCFHTAVSLFNGQEDVSKAVQAEYYERLAQDNGVFQVLDAAALAGVGVDTESYLIFAARHLDVAIEVYEAVLKTQTEQVKSYMDLLFQQDIGMPPALLGQTMEHKMKAVVNHVEEYAADREALLRPVVEPLLQSKNKNAKEAALRLIKRWDEGKIAKSLAQAKDGTELAALVGEIFNKRNRSKIPYADELLLTGVKLADADALAEPVLIEYYLSEYMLIKEVKKLPPCEEIRRFLDKDSLHSLVTDLYRIWIDNGADAKQKNILLPYAASADSSDIAALKKQMDVWAENSRGAMAAFAASVMALNGSSMALLILDSISKKYKNKQVKAAAEAAMERSAFLLGITKEELGDRIIPDLGFTKNREKVFDFGTRTFRGILTPELKVDLYEEAGKRIKNLPKAGVKDDARKAAAAAADYKDLKKQLKTVISSQKARLEEAIITGRTWEQAKWEQLFVENPVMNCFSIGLIWEEWDRQGNLLGTFRYMEDGSFNSSEEDEYQLQGDSLIALLHPLDVSAELIETWREQLEDYEITQPVVQLNMAVYTLTETERDFREITRYAGTQVYFGTIRGIMEKYDWKKTSIIDGGGYIGYYYEDAASGIGMQLSFDFLFVGMPNDESVKVENLAFYKMGTITYGSYTYDDIVETNRVMPRELPPKLASFALMVGALLAQKAL